MQKGYESIHPLVECNSVEWLKVYLPTDEMINCSKWLQVYLPTGGMVTVRNGYKQFLSVYYKASATDFMQTTGIVNIAHKELVN